MKYIAILFLAGLTTSCGLFENKSEEAVVLTIDTASMLKGRTIHADISVNNSNEAKHIARRK